VVVQGFYGGGNVGDDAILGATLNAVREAGAQPFVFAHDAEAVTRGWNVPALNHRDRPDYASIAALLGARALLLGGGGLLKDYGEGSANVARWLAWTRRAQRLGIPTMLWSMGVEQLDHPESRAIVREVVNRVDVITVRDLASADRLREAGVTRPIHVTADPVPALARRYRPASPPPAHGEPRHIVVSLRHWFSKGFETEDAVAFERFLTELADALRHLIHAERARVTLLPFRTVAYDDDREVLRDLADRVGTGVTLLEDPNPTVEETVRLMATADLVLAMRLHAAVIGTTLGVPTLAFGYMPKVADYMAEIGAVETVRAIPDIRADWILARAEAARVGGATLRHALQTSTDRLADRFDANTELLGGLLHAQRAEP
jgi:polysaccharide pyruvyl transferase CsaB